MVNVDNSTWFVSDTHWGHTNIIKYCDRPFETIEEMNETLIRNWNDRVKSEDDVYHLGDVCLGKIEESVKILSRLNGKKHLVAGNHDKKNRFKPEFIGQWEWIKDYHELEFGKQLVVLHHYSHRVWNKSHHGSFSLCGHSHGSLKATLPTTLDQGKCLDVGVDVHNFAPISYGQVKRIMDKKQFVAIDHHI